MIGLPLLFAALVALESPPPMPTAPTMGPGTSPPTSAPSADPSLASPSPEASPSAPSAAPSATPSQTPTATPYAYRFVPRQPEHPTADQPQIYAVYLNSKKLRSLGPISIKVATSPNVVRVVTRSNGREGAVPMIAPGDFEATSKLPKIPFIASGITTSIDFVGTTASGKRVTIPVPIVLE